MGFFHGWEVVDDKRGCVDALLALRSAAGRRREEPFLFSLYSRINARARARATASRREAVELATLEWVSCFNHHLLLEPLGYIPPAEAEANCYKELSSQAVPA
jgi:hypothetical protein